MKALVQRVSCASVTVGSRLVGTIGTGLLVLLGIEKGDTEIDVSFIAAKCANLRIFEDAEGRMNRSVRDIHGSMLVVSQFTLCADCRTGNRPSFDRAELPERARHLYEQFISDIAHSDIPVATGEFGARMQIDLVNDGPVTLLIESPK